MRRESFVCVSDSDSFSCSVVLLGGEGKEAGGGFGGLDGFERSGCDGSASGSAWVFGAACAFRSRSWMEGEASVFVPGKTS